MIGVFDSGLGGLTAVKELLKIAPDAGIVYFGDTGRVPYGTRSRETIISYALQDVRFLESRKVDAILIACGTVSSTAFDELCAASQLPITGVVDVTADAALAATRNGRVGIIGTPATVKSDAYTTRIHSQDPAIETLCVACPLFVPLVEEGMTSPDCEITRLAVERYLAPLKEAGIDTLILGCTHYPVLADAISAYLPGVTLINSGAEAARAMVERFPAEVRDGGGVSYFVSDAVGNFERSASIFLGHSVTGKVEQIDIEKY